MYCSLTRYLFGSQPNAIDWEEAKTPNYPRNVLETKRHIETSGAVFESSRRDAFNPCLTFKIKDTCQLHRSRSALGQVKDKNMISYLGL